MNTPLKDPDAWKGAPAPVAKAVAEVDRLQAVVGEQWARRDDADRAVNPAEQKDEQAIAKAYGDGGDGGKVNPTRWEDEARADAARQQKLLVGVTAARDAAVSDLRAAIAEHGPSWQQELVRELADAEGELAVLVGEARAAVGRLNRAANLLEVVRAGGSKTGVVHDGQWTALRGWTGASDLRLAVGHLEVAASTIGTLGEPTITAPFDGPEGDVEVPV